MITDQKRIKKNIMYLLMYYYKNCNNIYTPKLEVIHNFSSKNHQQQLKLEKCNLYLWFSVCFLRQGLTLKTRLVMVLQPKAGNIGIHHHTQPVLSFSFFLFSVLRTKPRAMCMLGKSPAPFLRFLKPSYHSYKLVTWIAGFWYYSSSPERKL